MSRRGVRAERRRNRRRRRLRPQRAWIRRRSMPRLYSYTMAHDDGAAPNPFRGLCTLAICKPKIRLKATFGDWVVGLGSVNAPSGDLGGRMIYAMRIDQVVTLRDY